MGNIASNNQIKLSMGNMIRLFVIEDHYVIISGLRNFFRPSRDKIEISITASGIQDAITHSLGETFDIILLDLWLEHGDPEENFRVIQNKFPGKPVIIYTHEQLFQWQRKMFRAGVKGYLVKTADKNEIKTTFEKVLKGETVYPASMQQFNAKQRIFGDKNLPLRLTSDQERIVQLLSDGYALKQIADKQGRSTSTIEKALKEIRKKYDANTNVELLKIILLNRQI